MPTRTLDAPHTHAALTTPADGTSPHATSPHAMSWRLTISALRGDHGTLRADLRSVAPGLLLASGVAVLCLAVGRVLPGVSPLLVAIVLGVGVGNAGRLVAALPDRVLARLSDSAPAAIKGRARSQGTATIPGALEPGLAVASRRLLRLGIVLLGLSVSVAQITALGAGIVAVAVAVVAGGFLVAEVVGRLLHVPVSVRILIGAGMSICGAAAVAAVEPVAREHARAEAGSRGVHRDARGVDGEAQGVGRDVPGVDRDVDEQVVTAIALVVALGTLMIGAVPVLCGALGLDPRVAGLWAGASIHEVAQVVATGGLLGGAALQAAVVVKLTRVLLLAPGVAILGLRARRAHPARRAAASGRGSQGDVAAQPPLVPLFVVGFLVAVGLRSLGVVPAGLLQALGMAQTLLFAAAMFALGCGVRVGTLRAVGGRPVVLAVVTTLTVAGLGLAGVLLVA